MTKKVLLPNQNNDAVSIGNRIKSTRMLSGHTRKSFAVKSGISSATLRFWEEPISGRHGLTDKGADRLIIAFNACGIHCTKEWLLLGKGYGSKLINTSFPPLFDAEDPHIWDEEEAILKDIESFKENNCRSIIAMISDNSMLPTYSCGDYVGGSKKYSEEINELIGLNCIVEIDDRVMVRRLIAGESKSKFSLIAINHDMSINEPIILNIELKSAAEIVFHRWKKKSVSYDMRR